VLLILDDTGSWGALFFGGDPCVDANVMGMGGSPEAGVHVFVRPAVPEDGKERATGTGFS